MNLINNRLESEGDKSLIFDTFVFMIQHWKYKHITVLELQQNCPMGGREGGREGGSIKLIQHSLEREREREYQTYTA